ncbi:hypothetical protein DSO57_1018099 [Entomophthora muscae]|uniref:Uncharacterized protein n=1 Tax=Entomophthora muscae TaxID=34485 RepID=A0ACC2TRZ5_9FUNG|nr:hypothetical protein DSO57_1018099 [Entomophthora muscae]
MCMYNLLLLGQRDASVTPPQSDLSQRMLKLQLESFASGVEGADIVSWLQSTKTCPCICQVLEPMWVATVSGRLTGPATVWFTNWASQEIEVTWAAFRDTAKSRYSKTFLPIVVGNLLLAIKQTGSVPKYLAAAPKAVTNRHTMLLVRNCTISAILIWPSNNDNCEDLTGFAFEFGNSLLSVNGSVSIFTHSGIPYLPLYDPGMTSSPHAPLYHSVYLMSDCCPLSTI